MHGSTFFAPHFGLFRLSLHEGFNVIHRYHENTTIHIPPFPQKKKERKKSRNVIQGSAGTKIFGHTRYLPRENQRLDDVTLNEGNKERKNVKKERSARACVILATNLCSYKRLLILGGIAFWICCDLNWQTILLTYFVSGYDSLWPRGARLLSCCVSVAWCIYCELY